MNEVLRECCRVLSLLLEYPEEEPEQLAERVSAYVNTARREGEAVPGGLEELAGRLSPLSLEELRQAYVELFDLTSGCSLYMAWHAYGDTPRQGRGLAALCDLYADAGYARLPGVLPDYLPLMLEFAAIAPEWATRTVCEGFLPHIRTLGERIAEREGIYAPTGVALVFLAERLTHVHGDKSRASGINAAGSADAPDVREATAARK